MFEFPSFAEATIGLPLRTYIKIEAPKRGSGTKARAVLQSLHDYLQGILGPLRIMNNIKVWAASADSNSRGSSIDPACLGQPNLFPAYRVQTYCRSPQAGQIVRGESCAVDIRLRFLHIMVLTWRLWGNSPAASSQEPLL